MAVLRNELDSGLLRDPSTGFCLRAIRSSKRHTHLTCRQRAGKRKEQTNWSGRPHQGATTKFAGQLELLGGSCADVILQILVQSNGLP